MASGFAADSALSVGQHGASDFQLGFGHEDLARAIGCDSLERGIRRLGNAVTAINAGRAKQPAHHLGLHLAGHCGNYNAVGHARRLLDKRPVSRRPDAARAEGGDARRGSFSPSDTKAKRPLFETRMINQQALVARTRSCWNLAHTLRLCSARQGRVG